VSITTWKHSAASTAKTLAHEIAHNLGIYHDFSANYYSPDSSDYNKFRHFPCGAEKYSGKSPGVENEIMNYGFPRDATFSDCSNYDFEQYYTSVVGGGKDGKFCLDGKSFKNVISLMNILLSLKLAQFFLNVLDGPGLSAHLNFFLLAIFFF